MDTRVREYDGEVVIPAFAGKTDNSSSYQKLGTDYLVSILVRRWPLVFIADKKKPQPS
jgi:hypothetical protein